MYRLLLTSLFMLVLISSLVKFIAKSHSKVPVTSRVYTFNMADVAHISNSESSEDDSVRTPERKNATREPSQPHSALSHRFRESPQMSYDDRSQGRDSAEDGFAVMVPAPARPWEYQPWRGDTTVETVLEEVEGLDGKQMYKIEFEDGRKEDVSVNFAI